MQMIEIQINDLSGLALDYVVDRIAAGAQYSKGDSFCRIRCGLGYVNSWQRSGPLIDHYKPKMIPISVDAWEASVVADRREGSPGLFVMHGSTFLVAALRAIAAHVYGKAIQVPELLINVTGRPRVMDDDEA